MGTPTLKLIFDRCHRASSNTEGAIELRITYNRKQKHVTTGVRVLPKHWRNGKIVNCFDAMEKQQTLDLFVLNARKVINQQMELGTLDMQTVVATIGGKQKHSASVNVNPLKRPVIEYFRERAAIRKHGRTEDSQRRYDRFLKWFENWGCMVTFEDINELNIGLMDDVLRKKGLKPYSIWNNFHRFLNSFILDAIEDGILRKNPYNGIHIDRKPTDGAIEKYLTNDELEKIIGLDLPVDYLRHARDLFVFQTYTCLSYIDMEYFEPESIHLVNGKPMYTGRRGKTDQEFTFLLLKPAIDVLDRYGGRLPMMSNQKYNQYLKMLSVMAGIDKPLSSHWARHTGATMLLNSGVPMEIVSKVLGHSSTTMTRRIYAALLDDTIAKEMEKVMM